MTDDATHPKVIALRTILSRLVASTDEYAELYKEFRAVDKVDQAKRKELSDRLTKVMLCMMSQAHLVQCRFFHTLAAALGEDQTMALMRDAAMSAHRNEDEENSQLHNLMKGHAPWQM